MKKRNNWPRSQARLSESHQTITANSENTTLSWPLSQFTSEYTNSTFTNSKSNKGVFRPLVVLVKLFSFLLGIVILEGLLQSIFAISVFPLRFGYFGFLVREILILNLGVLTLLFPVYLWLTVAKSALIKPKGFWLVASFLSTFIASLLVVALASQLLFLDLLSLSLYDILGIVGGDLSLLLINTFSKFTLAGISVALAIAAYIFFRLSSISESLEKRAQRNSTASTNQKKLSSETTSQISCTKILKIFTVPFLKVFKFLNFKINLSTAFSLLIRAWEAFQTPVANAISRKGRGLTQKSPSDLTSQFKASERKSLFNETSVTTDIQARSQSNPKNTIYYRLTSWLRLGDVANSWRLKIYLSQISVKRFLSFTKVAFSTVLISLQRTVSLQGIIHRAGSIYTKLTNLNIFTPKFEKDYVGNKNVRLGLDYQEIFASRKTKSLGYEARQKIPDKRNLDYRAEAELEVSRKSEFIPAQSTVNAHKLTTNQGEVSHDKTPDEGYSQIETEVNDNAAIEDEQIREVKTVVQPQARSYQDGSVVEDQESEFDIETPETLTRNPLFNPEPTKYESPKLFSWIKTGNNPLIATQAFTRKAEAIPTSPISTASQSYSKQEHGSPLLRRVERVDKTLNAGFSLDLLTEFPTGSASTIHFRTNEEVDENGMQILEQLQNFGVGGDIIAKHKGPVVSLYEFRPSKGVKVAKITGLQDELAMKLRATSVRIIAPLPGQDAVGIEVPNREHEVVGLKEILQSEEFLASRSHLTIALGKDSYGRPAVQDIAKMPHLLIAGATGTGKSVSINALLLSLLFKSTPEDLNLVLIDPKILELSVYEGIPHLKVPVITDCKKARAVLEWAVKEMERRYKLMQRYGVRNIDAFNKVLQQTEVEEQPPLSKVVIVIDELADLMFQVGKDLEELIARLAQKARASGIHLVLATQRPSVDVITGLIKANFPVRISFRVTSRIDSRTILDTQGADKLLGKGDMLLSLPGVNSLIRCHGAFVTDDDVRLAVNDLKERWGPPDYDPYIVALCEKAVADEDTSGENTDDEEDPMYEEALRVVIKKGTASTSMIQRALRIGYNRAARIIDMMEDRAVIGPQDGVKPREILINVAEAEEAYE